MKQILFALLVILSINAKCQDTTAQYGRIAYTDVAIVINIPDVIINQTVIKRTATLFTMTYNQYTQTLALNWTVKFYANVSGSYGMYLGGFIADYSKEIVATNQSFVNPATGAFVLPDANGKYPMNYMGQYDFFNMIAENQSLKVHSLIRQYGYQILDWSK